MRGFSPFRFFGLSSIRQAIQLFFSILVVIFIVTNFKKVTEIGNALIDKAHAMLVDKSDSKNDVKVVKDGE